MARQETVGEIPADVQARLNMLGRMGDGANAVMWLRSPEAAYITGVTLPVDGGATTGMLAAGQRYPH